MRRARVRAGDPASGRLDYSLKSILAKSAFPYFHRQERQPATAIAIPGETIHVDIPQKKPSARHPRGKATSAVVPKRTPAPASTLFLRCAQASSAGCGRG
jgi:hypothetical protein